MPRLPIPGQDNNVWGAVLNDFLSVEHAADGTLKKASDIAAAQAAADAAAADDEVVHSAGNETIDGIKTFSSSPLIPTPSVGIQAANKSYVDSGLSGKQDADATITALAAFNTNGILTQTAASSFTGRTITAGAGVSITNGDGVAGNPTVSADFSADSLHVLKVGDTMSGTLSITAANTSLLIIRDTNANSSTEGAGALFRTSTESLVTDDRLGYLVFGGLTSDAAGVAAYAAGTWSGSDKASYLTFETTTAGNTARNEKMRLTSSGFVGVGTSAPTHGLTLASTITGIAAYNTVDQVTNYERFRASWSSNIYVLGNEFGGAGATRELRVGVAGSPDSSVNRYLSVRSSTPFFTYSFSTSLTGFGVDIGGGQVLSASSGTQGGLSITPAITQTSTAGYTALLVNPTEPSTGSGAKLLADFQVGGTSRASIDNTGVVTAAGLVVDGSTLAVDAANNRVGIGTATPALQLTVECAAAIAGRGLNVSQINTGAHASVMSFSKSRGAVGALSTVANGDYTGIFFFNNYDGSAYRTNAGFGARTSGTIANNSVPTDLFFWTSITHDQDPFTLNSVRMVIRSSGNVGMATTTPHSTLQVNGSLATAFLARSTAYTLTGADMVVTGNATGGAFSLTLPTAVGVAGRVYTLKKIDVSGNAVTVATTSGQTIDGAANYPLATQNKYVTVLSDGANWLVVANN